MEKIIEATERVFEFVTGMTQSISTLKGYQSSYRAIHVFCKNNGIDHFGDSELKQFNNMLMFRYEKGEVKIWRFRQLRKAATLLADQMKGNKLEWRYELHFTKEMSESFTNALAGFYDHLTKTFANSTRNNAVSVARQFLLFLEGKGMHDFNTLSADDIKQFMIVTAPRYSNSMTFFTGNIKKFLSFLNSSGFTVINADKYLANPVSPRKKLLPCFTDEEVAAIFESVETSTSIGKRDYAIMKLAIGTGLRGVDIFGLKLSDIDWRKHEIRICQDKTDVFITIPLLPDVGNAIMDYILNGRPKAKNPYIFLRDMSPWNRLGPVSRGDVIIGKYIEKAGISHVAWDGKSFHAFRRTMGTKLVQSGADMESIRQIMGPKHQDSLKPYISLDMDGLRVCCLDLSNYATTKEGLA